MAAADAQRARFRARAADSTSGAAAHPRAPARQRYLRSSPVHLAQALERMEASAGETDADAADDESAAFVRFVYRSRWFVLAQTEGEATAAVAPSLPAIRRNTP